MKSLTISESLTNFKDNGLVIDINTGVAEMILSNIGAYHFGFYLSIFEQKYPNIKDNRDYKLHKDTKFSDVLSVYQIDRAISELITHYLYILEKDFKTKLLYHVYAKYPTIDAWYLDDTVVSLTVKGRENLENIYKHMKDKSKILKEHHKNYGPDNAPAYKALEIFSFGQLHKIYSYLKDKDLKKDIAKEYDFNRIKTFNQYMNVAIELRNVCAHGQIILDHKISNNFPKTPFIDWTNAGTNDQKLIFTLTGVSFLLKNIYNIDSPKTSLHDNFMDDFISIENNITDPKIKKIISSCIR